MLYSDYLANVQDNCLVIIEIYPSQIDNSFFFQVVILLRFCFFFLYITSPQRV